MTRLVAHRGPDGEGVFEADRVALGHRRLAIVDLSEQGHQPMHRGRLVLTFNGEIYNYRELRDELAALGARFESSSDSEVLLAAYERWGEDCLRRFNGMWAFAIYDQDRRQLFLSRDRFGVKPLFIVETPDAIAFGSEIKQLLPFLAEVQPNRSVLADFMSNGFTDLGVESFVRGIRRLAPGSWLRIDVDTLQRTERPFYDLAPSQEIARLTPEAAERRYIELLEDAVALRLRSDVPVGTCLSGGLDSSTIAVMAADRLRRENAVEPFSAITAVSENPGNDESAYAAQVGEAAGLRMIRVRPGSTDLLDSYETIHRSQDEPVAGPSLVMQYFVMQAARANGLTVLLDGQGGDETLLGYERYLPSLLRRIARDSGWPHAIREALQLRRHNESMAGLRLPMFAAMGLLPSVRAARDRRRMGYDLYEAGQGSASAKAFVAAFSDPVSLRIAEIRTLNLPGLLRYEDRNSMWHGIETRLPFLDYRVVEAALGMPSNALLRDGWTKPVLRRFLGSRVPGDVAWRRRKFGFEAPEQLWMRANRGAIRELVVRSTVLAGLFDGADVSALFDRWPDPIRWRALSVSIWERSTLATGAFAFKVH